jgi:hypothetical protein
MAHSAALFKGLRKQRNERRDSRRKNRDLRRNGPDKQYYGGSEDALAKTRATAEGELADASDRKLSAANKLDAVGDRANRLESDAGRDYSSAKSQYNSDRGDAQAAVSGLSRTAENAIVARNAAIAASPTMSQSAESALSTRKNELAAAQAQQAQAAQQRLSQSIGMNNRAALGMASGAGESGALGIQQAIATGAQGGVQALSDNNIQQDELLAQQGLDSVNVGLDTRMGAAGADRDALLARAQSDQALRYGAAQDTVNGNMGLLGASAGQQQLASGRQLNLLGQRADIAGGGAANALTDQGQMLGHLDTVNTGQLQSDNGQAMGAYNAAVAKQPAKAIVKGLWNYYTMGAGK